MKKIKFILKLSLSILFISTAFYSCDDKDKDLLLPLENAGTAPFAKFTDSNPPTTVGVNNISDLTYAFSVSNPNGTMTAYDLKMYANLSGTQTNTVDVDQVTSFPSEFSFTDESLAQLLGINSTDINFGDQFFFTATSSDASGNIYGGSISQNDSMHVFLQEDGTFLDDADPNEGNQVFDSNGDPLSTSTTGVYKIKDGTTNEYYYVVGQGSSDDLLSETGYRQAYEFNFIILCPPPATQSDFVGTWEITVDPFVTCISDCTFQMIAGPETNQVTALDIFDHPNPENGGAYDVIFNFNTAGEISVDRQPAWHCDNFGCPYGEGRINGSGFIFNCVGNGLMKMNFQHTVDLGSFGTFAMDMVKQ